MLEALSVQAFFLFLFLFQCEVSGGVDDWSVSSAFPLGCLKLFLFRRFLLLFQCEVSDGVDDWSVFLAFPLGWQLCTHVCIPKVKGLQSFPFVGLVCFS